ncbi:Ceramide glucosyltransferase [Penicillium daleae]|uniref:Ceramide glucosyltransferase n=1 Tax=Penicillium daleae TaxID=63821 RepID=A0AAD6G858_9EURO|nr:Ceramide glucosyltransferase [Penicillium daleae]KAJ5461887.1 Ceramide glucosyltransferase [Penicillium daleae]
MLEPASYLLELPIGDGAMPVSVAAGWVGLIWYITVLVVCALGYFQIWRYFLRRPRRSALAENTDAPHVTAIRPVKGLEPHLYDCLAATFRQDYPRDKLTVCLCVATRDDPAYPTLCKLLADFPDVDARVYVEEADPLLQGSGPDAYALGPNPKIRNMSRAYREAKGDIIWIIDCNVWVGKGVCGRMVDRLCGTGATSSKKFKFVHHLPVAVDVTGENNLGGERQTLLDARPNATVPRAADLSLTSRRPEDGFTSAIETGGGRLEELFLSSSHAKMYTAINTVLIAPCIVGKSNMFRRSHLDYLTAPAPGDRNHRRPGVDYFSDNICEDHLIGDLLWRKKIREEKELGERWGKHAMVFGDLAIQPVANMSIRGYIARRVRWLRVRKFTVLLATLVEPGTESFVCSIYGAWGITTALAPYLEQKGYSFATGLATWTSFFAIFALSIAVWILVDWTLYIKLHSAKSIELDEDTPVFARPNRQPSQATRRPFLQWFAAWLGRELLALPIWIIAVYGGVTVVWRDRRFKVGFDAKVREIDSESAAPSEGSYSTGSVVDWFPVSPQSNGGVTGKVRRD